LDSVHLRGTIRRETDRRLRACVCSEFKITLRVCPPPPPLWHMVVQSFKRFICRSIFFHSFHSSHSARLIVVATRAGPPKRIVTIFFIRFIRYESNTDGVCVRVFHLSLQ